MKQASDAVDRGNSALSVQYLKQAIGENPNLAEAHCSLGLIYLDQVANWPAAEQELRQGISIFERNKSTVFPGGDYKSSLSMCYAYLGYVVVEEAVIRFDIIHTRAVYEEAEGYYKKAVDLDPTNAKAQAGLKTVQATLEFLKQAPSKGR